jgi:putative GTP pyrophosphokinase
MGRQKLSKQTHSRIDEAVQHFVANHGLFESFAQALMAYFQNDAALAPCIHFIKYRLKDPKHLREKLIRKAMQGDIIDKWRLFGRITDLAGIRIIHLHTSQMEAMHKAILAILEEQQLRLVEKPTANCWDVEYESIFKSFGITPRRRGSMYTTVHYVIRANQKTKVTCEVQVRTLMDEVWGEVSHRINYPTESPSSSCKDQLKVLARLTSGCTRLVDSIFQSHLDASKRRRDKLT